MISLFHGQDKDLFGNLIVKLIDIKLRFIDMPPLYIEPTPWSALIIEDTNLAYSLDLVQINKRNMSLHKFVTNAIICNNS